MLGKLALAIVLLVSCVLADTKTYTPFDKIQAEDYTDVSNAKTAADCGDNNNYVGSIVSGSGLSFGKVDFQTGAKSVSIRVAGALQDGTTASINLRLDSATGSSAGSIPVGKTSGHCQFAVVNGDLSSPITGVHDLFVSVDFTPAAGTNTIEIDWLQFVKA